jgi:wobble nucleotide-excising tRNase
LARRGERSKLTIQNTLRRIVENYLTVLGGLKPEDIVAKFNGRDQQICRSLFSWVNAGSHSVHDEIFYVPDDVDVDGFLRVFRDVFDRTGHEAHYRMMMRIPDHTAAAAPINEAA